MSLFSYLRRRWAGTSDEQPPASVLERLDAMTGIDTNNESLRRDALSGLIDWLLAPMAPDASAAQPGAMARLRVLIALMEQGNERGLALRRLLAASIDGETVFTVLGEAGLPESPNLATELIERMLAWLLPPADARQRALAQALERLGDERLPVLLGALARHDRVRLDTVVARSLQEQQTSPALTQAVADALQVLATDLAAQGLSPLLRRRWQQAPGLSDKAWLRLPGAASQLADSVRRGDAEGIRLGCIGLRGVLNELSQDLDRVQESLEESGLSTALLHRLARSRAQITRLRQLAGRLIQGAGGWARLASELAVAERRQRGVAGLMRGAMHRLAASVVDRNADTGDHYIAETRAQWRHMLAIASGGGAIMTLAVFLKFIITSHQWPLFVEGLLASMNYAGVFLLIMLLGCTVATKQPAMTAPALSRAMAASGPGRSRQLANTVTALVRSQVAAVAGNLLLVAPCALLVVLLWQIWQGHAPIDVQKAEYVMHSHALLGPSLLFALWTAVLLWASGLVAGWADNAFTYRGLASAMRQSPTLNRLLGETGSARMADWWRHHVGGVAANVSLGLMLGMSPVIALFFGIPLEVRHVTLSMGQWSAAVGTLGIDALTRLDVWVAFFTILLIGICNVGAGFALAYRTALRARELTPRHRRLVRAAIQRQWREAPLAFVWPPREAATPDSRRPE